MAGSVIKRLDPVFHNDRDDIMIDFSENHLYGDKIVIWIFQILDHSIIAQAHLLKIAQALSLQDLGVPLDTGQGSAFLARLARERPIVALGAVRQVL